MEMGIYRDPEDLGAARVRNKRLWTDSLIRAHNEQKSIDGNAYNVNTGWIYLLDDKKTAVFYLKNKEKKPIVLENFYLNTIQSEGGSGEYEVEFIKNANKGKIIDSRIDCDYIKNRNFCSMNSLNIDAFKGKTGDDFLDGEVFFPTSFVGPVSLTMTTEATTIPCGSSIGVNITPPKRNKKFKMLVAFTCYLED